MRVRDQFILRTIADEHLLIPTGQAAFQLKGLIALSESGALLYNRLKDGCSREALVAALLFLPAGTLHYLQGWLLMGILFNALTLLGVDGSWQRFIRGFVMVVVIMFDAVSKMKKAK